MQIIWPQYFQIICLLLSLIFSRGLNKFKLAGFIPLLTIVCVVEFLGVNRASFGWKNNYFLYDCYLIVSFPVTYYVFYRMLAYKGWLRIVYFSLGFLILAFFILNMLFMQGSKTFNTYSLILTEFVITVISLMVLIKQFKDDDFTVMLYEHPYFWISGASLIFSVSTLVILGLQQYISSNHIQIAGKNIYKFLTPIMNIVLYTCYSYAFYLCHKLTSKSSQPS